MEFESKILVAGSNGMVGSAIVRNLENKGYINIIKGTRKEVDFTNQEKTFNFFKLNKPDYVFVAAAKVGGISHNKSKPADFIRDNLLIQTNIIDSAYKNNCKKLLFLGSSCIYPKFANQPITEDQLLTGLLEPTNDAYAIAKIAGIKMCQSYRKQYGFNCISLMPTNLYGPNDNFNLETSHVLPAMIAKVHTAHRTNQPEVTLWGDGSAMREFLHVDDLAHACYVCMQKYDEDDHINIGTGEDVSIKELANIVAKAIGYKGSIVWDTTKPNGTPRKVLNINKIKSLGWQAEIGLQSGIEKTYEWYQKNL
jgi:GDP-L-fucose synthase